MFQVSRSLHIYYTRIGIKGKITKNNLVIIILKKSSYKKGLGNFSYQFTLTKGIFTKNKHFLICLFGNKCKKSL